MGDIKRQFWKEMVWKIAMFKLIRYLYSKNSHKTVIGKHALRIFQVVEN